jgi:hypothetical protein
MQWLEYEAQAKADAGRRKIGFGASNSRLGDGDR